MTIMTAVEEAAQVEQVRQALGEMARTLAVHSDDLHDRVAYALSNERLRSLDLGHITLARRAVSDPNEGDAWEEGMYKLTGLSSVGSREMSELELEDVAERIWASFVALPWR
jgi:hypothetical protein